MKDEEMNEQFRNDILEGLKKVPKSLPSKYFYDAQGDYFFQKIMQSEDYYLPGCELEIFSNFTDQMHHFIGLRSELNVLELGAGDGTKTSIFLENLSNFQSNICYVPFDISENVLAENRANIQKKLPNLSIKEISGDYFSKMPLLNDFSNKVVLFMGSNIGNYNEQASHEFLSLIRKHLRKDDVLIIAVDLKKDPNVILQAYNDREGWTSRFNYNLLTRINRELGGDFKEEHFMHYPTYDPITGECRSFLISRRDQKVKVDDAVFHFDQHEAILVEISKKFDLKDLHSWRDKFDFSEVLQLTDQKGYYSINLYKV